ncbi:MAG: hypothetical protein WCC26_00185 [Terracidiphilus sp.]
MSQQIKGIVPPPFRMPPESQVERRRRAIRQAPRVEVPLLIRLFTWYCFLRATADLTLAVLARLSPDSPITLFANVHFNPIPPPIPPDAAFLAQALLYMVVGWRWFRRDWRARWGAMFLSGVTAANSAYLWITYHPAPNPTQGAPIVHQDPVIPLLVNLAICCYLAFYPGMQEAFSETSLR